MTRRLVCSRSSTSRTGCVSVGRGASGGEDGPVRGGCNDTAIDYEAGGVRSMNCLAVRSEHGHFVCRTMRSGPLKPEYLLRPRQLVLRAARLLRPAPERRQVVTLPFGPQL